MTVTCLRTGIVVGGLAAILAGCGGDGRPVPVSQAGVARDADRASATGEYVADSITVDLPLAISVQLYVEHDAVVVARAPGTVDSLLAELGDRVRTGQVLARLESAAQQIALDSAQAAYDNLLRVAARARALTRSGGTTAADSEQVEFQLREADIARRRAQRDLDLTRVTAPFDGVITDRFARPRRFVAVGDTLFRVTEAAPLFARVRIPESSAYLVRVGDRAAVVADADIRAAATVVHAAPIIDAASGTRELVLRVAGSGAPLVPGSAVRVEIGHERRRVLAVPRAAIAPDGYAVVVQDGRTTLRSVSVGRDVGGGRVEVLGGLSAGERLATPGR